MVVVLRIYLIYFFHLEYRLGQFGKVFQGGNLNDPPPQVDTEHDCWLECRQVPDCKGFAFIWSGDSMTGSCSVKGSWTHPTNDMIEGFVKRYKAGQNIYTNKGRRKRISNLNQMI